MTRFFWLSTATLALLGGHLSAQDTASTFVMLYQDVDSPPQLLASRALYYPQERTGQVGEVTFLVVIDTTGYPDAASIKVIKATDSAFEVAARRTLLAQHFSPGTARGQHVRVLMEHRVRFRPASVACTTTIVERDVALCVDSTASGQ